jgi:hypothetical protein
VILPIPEVPAIFGRRIDDDSVVRLPTVMKEGQPNEIGRLSCLFGDGSIRLRQVPTDYAGLER